MNTNFGETTSLTSPMHNGGTMQPAVVGEKFAHAPVPEGGGGRKGITPVAFDRGAVEAMESLFERCRKVRLSPSLPPCLP